MPARPLGGQRGRAKPRVHLHRLRHGHEVESAPGVAPDQHPGILGGLGHIDQREGDPRSRDNAGCGNQKRHQNPATLPEDHPQIRLEEKERDGDHDEVVVDEVVGGGREREDARIGTGNSPPRSASSAGREECGPHAKSALKVQGDPYDGEEGAGDRQHVVRRDDRTHDASGRVPVRSGARPLAAPGGPERSAGMAAYPSNMARASRLAARGSAFPRLRFITSPTKQAPAGGAVPPR